jgi:NTP pyrophosphatase (non-canonical NTP hydrolase)
VELAAAQAQVEAISRVYARLHGVERTDDWLVLKLAEEVGELVQAYLAAGGRSRHAAEPGALEAELADVLAHLLLVAQRTGVDLDAALEAKWGRWRHLVEERDLEGLGAVPGFRGDGTSAGVPAADAAREVR